MSESEYSMDVDGVNLVAILERMLERAKILRDQADESVIQIRYELEIAYTASWKKDDTE